MLGENTLYMRSNGIVGVLVWSRYEKRRLSISISDTIEELWFYREYKDVPLVRPLCLWDQVGMGTMGLRLIQNNYISPMELNSNLLSNVSNWSSMNGKKNMVKRRLH
jgi:hypothetical protein